MNSAPGTVQYIYAPNMVCVAEFEMYSDLRLPSPLRALFALADGLVFMSPGLRIPIADKFVKHADITCFYGSCCHEQVGTTLIQAFQKHVFLIGHSQLVLGQDSDGNILLYDCADETLSFQLEGKARDSYYFHRQLKIPLSSSELFTDIHSSILDRIREC